MDLHTDACEAEPGSSKVVVQEASSEIPVGDMHTGNVDVAMEASDAPTVSAFSIQEHESYTTRNETVRIDLASSQVSVKSELAGMDVEVGVVSTGPSTLDELSDTEVVNVLKEMVVAMFIVGAEASIAFGTLEKIAGSQNIRLWMLVKQAVHDVFESKEHRGSICRSPERPDLRLSQEEAQGYVAGAVFGIEMLSTEARSAGLNVNNAVAAEKKAAETDKSKFKSRRKSAKDKAAKDADLFASLDKMLTGIELDAQAAKTARLGRPYPIELPAAETVIVDGPAPVHWRARDRAAEQREEEEEEALPTTSEEVRELAQVAEAKAVAAEAQYEAACTDALRAAKSLARLPEEAASPAWGLQGGGVSERERAHRARQRETWIRAFAKNQAFIECLPMMQRGTERVRARADLLVAYARELEAAEAVDQEESVEARLERALAERRASQERQELRALMQRLVQARLEELERPKREKTRASLHADAEREWGAGWQTQPAQSKTISLVGVSPAGLRSLGERAPGPSLVCN